MTSRSLVVCNGSWAQIRLQTVDAQHKTPVPRWMLPHAARTPRSCSSASSLPLEAERETVTCCAAGPNTSDPSSFRQLVASRPKIITSSTLNTSILQLHNSVSCMLHAMTLSRVVLQSVFRVEPPPRYTPVTAVLLRMPRHLTRSGPPSAEFVRLSSAAPAEAAGPQASRNVPETHDQQLAPPNVACDCLSPHSVGSCISVACITCFRRAQEQPSARPSTSTGICPLPPRQGQRPPLCTPCLRLEVNLQRPEWQFHTPRDSRCLNLRRPEAAPTSTKETGG